jgi:two-component system OmpR family sensor kinase
MSTLTATAAKAGLKAKFSDRYQNLSLRRRLLMQTLSVFAVVCIAIGFIIEIALTQFLTAQLDSTLTSSAQLSKDNTQSIVSTTTTRPTPTFGQPQGTLVLAVKDGKVLYATMLEGGTNVPLASDVSSGQFDSANNITVTTKIVTLSFGKYGTYRALAVDGPNGTISVVSLSMGSVTDMTWRLGLIIAGVTIIGMVVATAIGALLIGRTLQPLRRVSQVAKQVAATPIDRGEVNLAIRVPAKDAVPTTEIGQVASALNLMLNHVDNALAIRQDSETKVRRFVADASHELRTPLASIRGYAELIRRVGMDMTPEGNFAVSRIESETTRLTELVEELLLLARLDENAPVIHEPVDLTMLMADAVADAHVASRDHQWRMDFPDAPVMVSGDKAQLHQVLVNLLSNARKHTPAGTNVLTQLTIMPGDKVKLSVIDDGQGIPAAQLPEVFERFTRGDAARVRTAGSTGLGLAIVTAVVQSHNGTVSVASRPGQTTFSVILPTIDA